MQNNDERAAAPVSGGEREQFEAWASAENYDLTREIDGDGYFYNSAAHAWGAWQARAAVAASQAAPVVGELPDTRALFEAAYLEHYTADPADNGPHVDRCWTWWKKGVAAVAAAKVPTVDPIGVAVEWPNRHVDLVRGEPKKSALAHWKASGAIVRTLHTGAAPVEQGQGAAPVAYADPQAFRNFQAGTAGNEWMWAKPDAGLVPLYLVQGAGVVPEALRLAVEEAAGVLESAATHNRSKGRTVLERTQQDRADRLRLALAAAPAPAVAAADQVRDAARYRWLVQQFGGGLSIDLDCGRNEIDETIDGAIQSSNPEGEQQ